MMRFSLRSLQVVLAGGSLCLNLTACETPPPKTALAPPAPVTQTLQALYPQADSVRWKQEEEGYYEGHFQLDQLPHKIRVEPDGRWRETEIELARPALPVPLQDSLDRLLDLPPRTRRIRATSIIHFADGHTSYEVQVRQPDKKWYRRLYDARGHTLHEERIKRG